MKKISLIIISIIFFTTLAWSEKVEVKNDQFTKAKVVTLDTWHKVIEGQLDNTRILYEKEIKDGKTLTPVAKFEFQIRISPGTGYGGEDLDPIGYVLIDDASFKVNLIDVKKTTQETIHGNKSSVSGHVSVSSFHTAYIRCNIAFTQEMINKILNAEKLMFRVSTNNNPTVMEAKKSQLKKVKEFFAAN